MTRGELMVKLRPVFMAFGREATDDLIDVYFTVLGKMPRHYVDRAVRKALDADREFMPPPGVIRSLAGVPPRCNGDGIPTADETERLQLSAVTCEWHSNADNWHGDDPPPKVTASCPKCKRRGWYLPPVTSQRKIGPTR